MENRLLALGLLMSAEMHGYQLHEAIEAHLGDGAQLKKPTLYKLLNKLHDEGWLSAHEEPGERNQTRRIFKITEKGRTEFLGLLRQSLAAYHPTNFSDHFAIAYLDYLPKPEVIPLLEQRLAKLNDALNETTELPEHAGSLHLFIDHQRHHLQSEIAWLDGVIKKLKAGEKLDG